MSTARCLLRAGVEDTEAEATVVHVLIAAREVGEAEPAGEVRDVLDLLDLLDAVLAGVLREGVFGLFDGGGTGRADVAVGDCCGVEVLERGMISRRYLSGMRRMYP